MQCPLETQRVHKNTDFTRHNRFKIRVVHSTVQYLFHFKNKQGNTINIYVYMHMPVHITMTGTDYAFQISCLIVPNVTYRLEAVVEKQGSPLPVLTNQELPRLIRRVNAKPRPKRFGFRLGRRTMIESHRPFNLFFKLLSSRLQYALHTSSQVYVIPKTSRNGWLHI